MSIRFKLILAYVLVILFSISLLVGGMVKATSEFVQNFAQSTIGDQTVEEAMVVLLNVLVDIEYISRYDGDLINDNDYIEGIETQLSEFDAYMFVEQEGAITYNTRYNDSIEFSSFYKSLTYGDQGVHNQGNIAFEVAKYDYAGNEYVILKHGISDLVANGNIYIMMPQKDMSGIGSGVFLNWFKGIMLIMIIVIIIITVLITQLVIKPIALLEESTEKIRQGELDFSIKTNRKDEIGRVINAFDIMREELHKSIEKQLQYEENRKELIASISHDLKTPITSIKGYVEGIKDGVASDKNKLDRYLDVIYHKSMDLDQLIDDLFLFSKLDLNRVPFNYVELEGRRFFDDSYDEIKMDLEKSGFDLVYNNDIDNNTRINIDPQQFKRVVINIINNAVKYSNERKTIVMAISESELDIHIQIKDYGKGIDPEDVKQIFDKFYRCDPARNTDIKGSGLGLAIAKQIIDRHEGDIWAESDIGIGTSIHIRIRKIKGGHHE